MKYTYTDTVEDRHYFLMSLEEVMEGIINDNQGLIDTLKIGLDLDTVGMNVYFTKRKDRTNTYSYASFSSTKEIEGWKNKWYSYKPECCVNNPAIHLLINTQED